MIIHNQNFLNGININSKLNNAPPIPPRIFTTVLSNIMQAKEPAANIKNNIPKNQFINFSPFIVLEFYLLHPTMTTCEMRDLLFQKTYCLNP